MTHYNDDDAVEVIHITDGVRLRIECDVDAENPRDYNTPTTCVLSDTSQYTFGDAQWAEDKIKWALSVPPDSAGDMNAYETQCDEYRFYPCQHYVLPVYIMCSHIVVTINTTGFSRKWDSGLVGCIYINKECATKEWPTDTEARAFAYMVGEIETLDEYLSGELYRYVIVVGEDDPVESCGGLFGLGYCIKAGRAAAAAYVAQRDERQAQERADLDAPYKGL